MTDLQIMDKRLAAMELSLQRMESAVTSGMGQIGSAMESVAHVMNRFQENAEDHKTIHRRIDEVHDETERNKESVLVLDTQYGMCCGNKVPQRDPVNTALMITAWTIVGLTYLALVMLHGKEMMAIVFK